MGFDSWSRPINRRVCLVIRHSIIKNKIDISLMDVGIFDKRTNIVTEIRNKVYLEIFESRIHIFIQLLVNDLPTHRFLDDIEVIGCVCFWHRIFEKTRDDLQLINITYLNKITRATSAIVLPQKSGTQFPWVWENEIGDGFVNDLRFLSFCNSRFLGSSEIVLAISKSLQSAIENWNM